MKKDALKLSWTLAIFVGVLCLFYNIAGNPLNTDGGTIAYCFVGFACTVALGMEPKKFPHYMLSSLAGWGWGYLLFWLLTYVTCPLLGTLPGNLVGGLIFGIVAFYLHLGVFENTVLGCAPLLVCSIATCFATSFSVWAMLSLLLGVICACLVLPLNSVWSRKSKAKS